MRSPFLGPLVVSVLLALATGCQISSGAFFPAHSRSDGRKAERVWVEPVLVDAAGQIVASSSDGSDWTPQKQADFLADWDAAFPETQRSTAFRWREFPKAEELDAEQMKLFAAEAVAAQLLPAVIEAALKLVERTLEKESSKYEAQFRANYAIDGFWETGYAPPISDSSRLSFRPRFAGFRVRRSIAGQPFAHCVTLGLAPSRDLQMFRIAPLSVEVGQAKAKVLSDEFLSWALPTSLIRKLFQTDGHHLRIRAHVEVDGYQRRPRGNGEKTAILEVLTLAGADLEFPQYDLNAEGSQRAGCDKRELAGMATAWFAIPGPDSKLACASCARGGAPGHQGNLLLRVLVTESDPSNIQELLEDGAELVSKQREKLAEKRKEGRGED